MCIYVENVIKQGRGTLWIMSELKYLLEADNSWIYITKIKRKKSTVGKKNSAISKTKERDQEGEILR